VRGLADGADGWTNVVSAVAEKTTRRVLDWFHISMRLRPIEQMSSRIAIAPGSSDAVWNELLNEKLPRIRDQMSNGQWHAAWDRTGKIYRATKQLWDARSTGAAEWVRRFRQHFTDLRDYLRSNWSGLRNLFCTSYRSLTRPASHIAKTLVRDLRCRKAAAWQNVRSRTVSEEERTD
jgi:hypothetical protein